MSKFFKEIKSALKEIFRELSQEVIYKDKTFNCTITNALRSAVLEVGGFTPEESFNVKFLESELSGFAVTLQTNTALFFSGKKYRINSVSNTCGRGQIEVAVTPWGK